MSKKLIGFTSVIIALVMLSCNLVPSFIINLVTSPTPTSTSTPTATATSTSTPTATATPQPPLSLYGCPIRDYCDYATSVRSILGYGLTSGVEEFVQIPYNTPLVIGLGWYAIDQTTLDRNLESMEWFFRIDGRDYDVLGMFSYGIALDEYDNEYPGYYFGVVISGWKMYENHRIEYGYTITRAINDGWYDYEPQTVTFTFTAMPGPLATATPTIAPTRTPVPYVGPTQAPPTATVSCNANKQIHILNSTGATVNLFLTGPATFHFYLSVGDNYLNVCAGGYSYTGYGCGGAQLNGEIHSGDSTEFYCVSY